MREKWARRIALLTGVIVVLLAGLFALIQNPTKPPAETSEAIQTGIKSTDSQFQKPVVLDPKQVEAGYQLYQLQGCAKCHAISGKGNPRNPLDGVGLKNTTEELRDWITGADAIKGQVSSEVLKLKITYNSLSDEELETLLIYLKSLR